MLNRYNLNQIRYKPNSQRNLLQIENTVDKEKRVNPCEFIQFVRSELNIH